MSLRIYQRKRKFSETPEPRGKVSRSKRKASVRKDLRFVVQMHAASRLHFDLRLEFDGVFKSWAIPKGPSLNPLDQRLAVFVEDHPLEYGSFEGIIPKGNYGAGTVLLWDEGTYTERGSKARDDSELAMRKNFAKGHITFVLHGHKLRGEFALIRLRSNDNAWLLVKKRDEFSTYKRTHKPTDESVKTGRTLDEVAKQSQKKGVWLRKSEQADREPRKSQQRTDSGPRKPERSRRPPRRPPPSNRAASERTSPPQIY